MAEQETQNMPDSGMPSVSPGDLQDPRIGLDLRNGGFVIPYVQNHTVPIGRRIQPNGNLYKVSSGVYVWELRDPQGDIRPLMNATMPGPSFIPDMLGVWVAVLETDEGPAVYNFNVVEDN